MRRRVGLIIPSSNRMVEGEMLAAFLPGAQPHVTRLRITGAHHVDLERLLEMVGEATQQLLDARCDAIAFHCTANSMEAGPEGEAAILAAMRAAGGTHVTTTATAIRAAFETLGARRIVLVTPYGPSVTAKEAAFLGSVGIEVVHWRAFQLAGSDAYCSTPARFWRDGVLAERREAAEAYLVSCANISVFPVVAEIERELGRPVVTSNQAVLWHLLRLAGTEAGADLPGRLFDAGREART
jgi:maleate isomerase